MRAQVRQVQPAALTMRGHVLSVEAVALRVSLAAETKKPARTRVGRTRGVTAAQFLCSLPRIRSIPPGEKWMRVTFRAEYGLLLRSLSDCAVPVFDPRSSVRPTMPLSCRRVMRWG